MTKDGHMIVNGIDFDEERPLLLRRNADVIPLEKLVGADGRILLPPMSSVGAAAAIAAASSTVTPTTPPTTSSSSVSVSVSVPMASTSTGYGSTDVSAPVPAPVPVTTRSSDDDDDYQNSVSASSCDNHTTTNRTISDITGGEGVGGGTSSTTSDNTAVYKAPIIEKSAPSAEKATSVVSSPSSSSPPSYQDSASLILKQVSNMSNNSTGTMDMDRSQKTLDELLEDAPVAIHVLSTMSILAVAFYCAVALPSVGVVWSICGSSMSIMIGFFVPAACYLKIRTKKGLNNPRTIASLFMVCFSVIASVVCTSHVIADVRLDQQQQAH